MARQKSTDKMHNTKRIMFFLRDYTMNSITVNMVDEKQHETIRAQEQKSANTKDTR